MWKHYVFMSSSYSKRTRIAYEVKSKDIIDSEEIKSINKEIKTKCGQDVRMGFQFLAVDSEKWEDVVRADGFFKDILVLPTLDEFIELINKDRDLTANDVANYIICKLRCTHLRMQKVLYLCYADYLCQTGEKLFEDKIFAYSYGPVVSNVYDTYKGKYGDLSDTSQKMPFGEKVQLAARSKILFTKEGTNKAFSIDKTIERYKHYSARALVAITHRKGSPWSQVSVGKQIPDEFIKAYHHIEEQKRNQYYKNLTK